MHYAPLTVTDEQLQPLRSNQQHYSVMTTDVMPGSMPGFIMQCCRQPSSYASLRPWQQLSRATASQLRRVSPTRHRACTCPDSAAAHASAADHSLGSTYSTTSTHTTCITHCSCGAGTQQLLSPTKHEIAHQTNTRHLLSTADCIYTVCNKTVR
jgi:L-serine deaminase